MALLSLAKGSRRPDHIIVIDHADSPYTLPNVSGTLVRPEENTGYVGGMMRGLKEAKRLGASPQDLCFVLNNDASVAKNSIQTLFSWWDMHGNAKTLAGAVWGAVSLWSGRASLMRGALRTRSGALPYIHGSCLVAEFQLFGSLPLPQDLFLYWEDVAMSMAVIQDAGTLAVVPGLRLRHNDKKGPLSDTKLYYLVRNGAYVLQRHPRRFWRVYWRIANMLREVCHALVPGRIHKVAARALRDARVGQLGKMSV